MARPNLKIIHSEVEKLEKAGRIRLSSVEVKKRKRRTPTPLSDISPWLQATFQDTLQTQLILDRKIQRQLFDFVKAYQVPQKYMPNHHPYHGLLFTGESGCGKTLTAQVLATTLELPLFIATHQHPHANSLPHAEIIDSIFETANKIAGIYLFDRFDEYLISHNINDDVSRQRFFSHFVDKLPQLHPDSILIVALRDASLFSPVMMRHFSAQYHFSRPKHKEIRKIIKRCIRDVKSPVIFQWSKIIEAADGLSPAAIRAACELAVNAAQQFPSPRLTTQDLITSLRRLQQSQTPP